MNAGAVYLTSHKPCTFATSRRFTPLFVPLSPFRRGVAEVRPRVLRVEARSDGSVLGVRTYEASEDGQLLTVTTVGRDANGADVEHVIVLERQESSVIGLFPRLAAQRRRERNVLLHDSMEPSGVGVYDSKRFGAQGAATSTRSSAV